MKWSTLYILASVFIFSVQFYKVSYGDDKVIISFILLTFMFDSGVIW